MVFSAIIEFPLKAIKKLNDIKQMSEQPDMFPAVNGIAGAAILSAELGSIILIEDYLSNLMNLEYDILFKEIILMLFIIPLYIIGYGALLFIPRGLYYILINISRDIAIKPRMVSRKIVLLGMLVGIVIASLSVGIHVIIVYHAIAVYAYYKYNILLPFFYEVTLIDLMYWVIYIRQGLYYMGNYCIVFIFTINIISI